MEGPMTYLTEITASGILYAGPDIKAKSSKQAKRLARRLRCWGQPVNVIGELCGRIRLLQWPEKEK